MPDSAATQVEDARIAAARSLLPLARAVLDAAKRQADAIDRTERRFGTWPVCSTTSIWRPIT
jgi:hypothetical protein